MSGSIYIHIPFCRRKCIYCNFYSQIYDHETASSYIDVLTSQIERLGASFATVYIGGGTPTTLDIDLLGRLLRSFTGRLEKSCEFTVEANPESLDEEKVKLFLDNGVNRLSIGLQSLREEKLKKLGRIHDAKKARDSVFLAHKKGFRNISVDSIFGVWGEDVAAWKKELEELVRLPITHVSSYELTYEKGTPLFSALANKSLLPPDDDVMRKLYECAIDMLSLRGFKQYEVSNFAKEGYESRHNINYWKNDPYTGLGPAAFSYTEGIRKRNVSDVREYIARVREGRDIIEFSEKLTPVKSAKETAALKIRTREGIDFRWFEEKTGFDFMALEKNSVKELLEKDLIKYKKDGSSLTGIVLKRKGLLMCDTVSSTLL